MSLFAKMKSSLSKTREAFSEKLNLVFSSFRKVDEEFFEELEETLILSDVGAATAKRLCDELRKEVKLQNISEPSQIKELLKEKIKEIFASLDSSIELSTTPTVILVMGVNGVGKTTSIGKLAYSYKKSGKKVILAAADTFRAAAAEQLSIWAERAGVQIVSQGEGADPAAVVFDAIASAKAKGADVVICDTAGRLHNKKHLMDELNKIYRVVGKAAEGAKIETLIVLDAGTGQNALSQCREFSSVANMTGVILTKLDGTAKGGIAIPIASEMKLPIKLIGLGEGIEDLKEFSGEDFSENLF